jgi:hypothetical protein
MIVINMIFWGYATDTLLLFYLVIDFSQFWGLNSGPHTCKAGASLCEANLANLVFEKTASCFYAQFIFAFFIMQVNMKE